MGSFYMESTQINYRRDETLKTVDQKLQELSETSAIDTDIAPVFKSINTYQPGDMVYYRNKLYVFNVEHTGAWAAADVTATDVTTELSSLKSGLIDVNSKITGAFSTEGLTTTGCDIEAGGYAKIGNLVFVQLLIKATSALSIKINKFPKGVGPIGVSQYPPLITADDSDFLFANFKSDGMEIFSYGQAPVVDNVYKVSCLYLAQ